MSQILKASLAYTAIVFGIGFVLGAFRVVLVVPSIGMRWAELLEIPLMLTACFFAARLITKRWAPLGRSQCLTIGGLSLALLLGAELSMVLAQGLTISVYVASRDPISGSAYLLSLLVFAALPALLNRVPGANNSLKLDGSDGPPT